MQHSALVALLACMLFCLANANCVDISLPYVNAWNRTSSPNYAEYLATTVELPRGGGKGNGTLVANLSTGGSSTQQFTGAYVTFDGYILFTIPPNTISLNLSLTITDVWSGPDRWDYECFIAQP